MHIDWWTLGLQVTNVLILVWLLSRFLFRPVMAAIAARAEAADKLLANAEAAKKAAAEQEMQAKALTDGFAKGAAERRATLEAAMTTERQRLLDHAKGEAEDVARQGEAMLAAERTRLTAELEGKAAELAGRMAQTLLARIPAAAMTDALFDLLLDHLRALPEEERRKLAADAPLAIVTATPVEAGRQAPYREALAALLPWTQAPAFLADPALIAGFEISGPHIRVRNSWRADLDAMLAELREKRG